MLVALLSCLGTNDKKMYTHAYILMMKGVHMSEFIAVSKHENERYDLSELDESHEITKCCPPILRPSVVGRVSPKENTALRVRIQEPRHKD